MPRFSNQSVAMIAFIFLALAALAIVSCGGTSMQLVSDKHPEAGKNLMCSECHEDKKNLDHTKNFLHLDIVRTPQYSDCKLCHTESGCAASCHDSWSIDQ